LPAERIQAGKDRGEVISDIAPSERASAGSFEIVALASSDDNDAPARRARRRLDHELRAVANDLPKSLHIAVATNDTVRIRHGNAGRMANFLRDRLVVDARIQRA